MTATVRLSFGPTEVICHVPEGSAPWSAEAARRWLDERFVEYDCEPLRASGKVLTKDKLVAIAVALGARALQADAALRADYAAAAAAALGSAAVHVDVDAQTVSA